MSSRPQTTPRPKIKWTAISLLQRGIPNLFDRSNRSKTIQPAKRKYSFVAGLENEEDLPAPKRRGTQRGFSPELDHLVQTQPHQSGNGQVGSESQPGPEIPEDTIGEVDYRRIRPTTRREIRDVRDALISTGKRGSSHQKPRRMSATRYNIISSKTRCGKSGCWAASLRPCVVSTLGPAALTIGTS